MVLNLVMARSIFHEIDFEYIDWGYEKGRDTYLLDCLLHELKKCIWAVNLGWDVRNSVTTLKFII